MDFYQLLKCLSDWDKIFSTRQRKILRVQSYYNRIISNCPIVWQK